MGISSLESLLADFNLLQRCCSKISVMPAYYLQDCHYFYRTALRGLNICTTVAPLFA